MLILIDKINVNYNLLKTSKRHPFHFTFTQQIFFQHHLTRQKIIKKKK